MHIRMNDNKYCDYQTVNTLLVKFEKMAALHGVQIITDMDMRFSLIDDDVLVKVLKFALVFVTELCDGLPEGREKYVKIRAATYPQWCMGITCPCREDARSDENGFPLKANGQQDLRGGFLTDTLRAHAISTCFNVRGGEFSFFFMDPPSHIQRRPVKPRPEAAEELGHIRVLRTNDNPYCDHPAVNRVLEEFAPTAERLGIKLVAEMELTDTGPLGDDVVCDTLRKVLELFAAVCAEVPEGGEQYIRIRAVRFPQWALAVDCPCDRHIRFDRKGYIIDEYGHREQSAYQLVRPFAARRMTAFFNHHNGELSFLLAQPSA